MRVSKDFERHDSMFTPTLCNNLANMPDQGCGAYNRGDQSPHPCIYHIKKKNFYTRKGKFVANKPMKLYKHLKKNK